MTTMTEAQKDTLRQVKNLLSEHFEASVVIVQFAPMEDEKKETHRCFWEGGWSVALGLVTFAHNQILTHESKDNETDSD